MTSGYRVLPIHLPFQIPIAPGKSVPRQVYAYAVLGPTITLIDTGVAGSERSMYAAIQAAGHAPDAIRQIILTHAHPDHIGSAKLIQTTYACSIAAHNDDVAWIEDVDLQNRSRPVPGFQTLVAGSVHIDRVLHDGDMIDLEGAAAQVIHTPGHSPGSISLFLPDQAILFCGDAIPRRGEMPIYDDVQASVRSISRLRSLRGIQRLCWAWDRPVEGDGVYQCFEVALAYLQHVHDAVLAESSQLPSPDPIDLCRRVVARLGLPDLAANPLVARSFMTHVKLRQCTRLTELI